ncbi:MAG: hypothetical protein Q8Q14_17025 [Gemmatimonadales bacterium]|nr:hypothetical protein [Gemmatimonadales bacterium]
MRCTVGKALAAVLALAIVFASTPAWSENVAEVRTGTPAPFDGVLIDLPVAEKVVEDARDARSLREVNALLAKQVEEMRAATRLLELALAKAEAREELRREMDGRVDLVLAESRRTLEDTRALVVFYERQMERMERRMLVTQILGVLGPLGLAAAFFLR